MKMKRKYGIRWVKLYGLEWYKTFKPKKHHPETPDPGECNIHLVREAYTNWDMNDPEEICVRGDVAARGRLSEDVTRVKNPKDVKGQTFTAAHRHARDDFIMEQRHPEDVNIETNAHTLKLLA
ncbi:hypothetical protein RND71_030719 [Anisodus tanguticus]|uniref:Uncharacterized protein n=1 Tax=Anisodus tanguticus TaxID=243964 RepID=A0AAE1RGL6_9SOLA|nr:hypothetical protein RND71_030719 [Anisodus tanguticus]